MTDHQSRNQRCPWRRRLHRERTVRFCWPSQIGDFLGACCAAVLRSRLGRWVFDDQWSQSWGAQMSATGFEARGGINRFPQRFRFVDDYRIWLPTRQKMPQKLSDRSL